MSDKNIIRGTTPSYIVDFTGSGVNVGTDGSVTATNYSFKGEYLRWKVIHAS